ncbi:MAG: hypothetical protein QUV05_18520 [Phycisphaerae bacterium]|nr:hypothetical protein [Phycisphaerae bacterium]
MKRLILTAIVLALVAIATRVLLQRDGHTLTASAQASDPPTPLTPAQQLEQAESLIQAHGEAAALEILREVVNRKDEDRVSAAKAQLRIGEVLFLNFRDHKNAQIELRKVLSDFPDQVEWVNCARVRLLNVLVFDKKWDEVPAIASAVVADARAGLAGSKQACWALFYSGLMHQEIGRESSIRELRDQTLSERAAAGTDYMHALAWENNWSTGGIALKHLIELLCDRHRYGDVEREANPPWLSEARATVALALTSPAPADEPPAGTTREESIDRVGSLIRLAHVAEQARDSEEAITWYRLIVTAPTRTPDQEREAAHTVERLLTESGHPQQAEQWLNYLLYPGATDDPTTLLATTRLGITPPGTDVASADVSSRFSALGRLQLRQRRYSEAEAMFTQALRSAQRPRHQGAALTGLAKTYQAMSGTWRQQYRLEEFENAIARARQNAVQARQAWLAAMKERPEDVHYATEQAVKVMRAVGLFPMAIETAEQIIADPAISSSPRDLAFAQYMKVQALGWDHQYDEAIQLARDVDQAMAADPDPIVEVIRVACLIRAAVFAAEAEEARTGLDIVAEVNARFPGRFAHWTNRVEKLCNKRLYEIVR